MMRSLPTCFALFLAACTCGVPAGPDCSTAAKCATAVCVNSGCHFDDAGKALPTRILGAAPPPVKPIELQAAKLGVEYKVSLDRSTVNLSKDCSQDALGAGFFLESKQSQGLSALVSSPNQVALAVFRVDEFGRRLLEKCVRTYNPEVPELMLPAGRVEFVLTGKGKARFSVTKQAKRTPLLFSASPQAAPHIIKANEQLALQFKVGDSPAFESMCGVDGQSYRTQFRLKEKGMFSLSVPAKYGDVRLGIREVGTTDLPHCAPPLNQSLIRNLAAGVYEVAIETKAPMVKLADLPWRIRVNQP